MSIKIKTVTQKLPCKLTDTEVQAAGTELASVIESISVEEERQKEVKAGLKQKLAELNKNVIELASKVSKREELRDVEVSINLVPDTMLVNEVRIDTGEIVKTRKADNDELQSNIDF